MVKVIIGIQARSTSSRFPGKVFQLLDGKEILQHIIDAADRSAIYLNKYGSKNSLEVKVVTLIPRRDAIKEKYSLKTIIFEGSENNVLERYWAMAELTNPNFIVRLTSDCPLIPAFIITKHINVAVMGNYDYVSNVDETTRTAVDGHDCEVISIRALKWAYHHAQSDYDREHVTPILRSDKIPPEFRVGHIIGHLSQKEIKLSLDNEADLERIKKEYDEVQRNINMAVKKHGKSSVHRI